MKELLMGLTGTFTWSFGQEFLIETEIGNFTWNDPDYGGDNTIKKFDGDYKDWVGFVGIPYGRDKGIKFISSYCGDAWEFVE